MNNNEMKTSVPFLFKKKRNGDKSGNVFFYVMVALPIIQFIIFYIVVNFNSILLAFKEYTVTDKGLETVWVKFDNFKDIVHQWKTIPKLQYLIPNAFLYFGITVCVIMPLTLLFGYYIYKKLRFYGFYRIMLFLPSIICSMVIIMFYRDFVEWVVRPLVGKMTDAKIDTLWGMDGAKATAPLVILYVLISFANSILLYLNAMSSISESTIEAAKIDGASELRTFWHVVLPAIWGTIISILVLAFVELGMGQANLYSIYGSQAPEKQQTLGYYVFNLVASKNGEDPMMYPIASAYGLMITLVIAPLTITTRHLLLKYGPSED